MKNYKSGILGTAEVRFGGKISIAIVSSNDGTIHGLAFSEFYKAGKVGETIPESVKIHSPQVYLVFDSIKSIEIVEKALMKVRELLKRKEEKKKGKRNEGQYHLQNRNNVCSKGGLRGEHDKRHGRWKTQVVGWYGLHRRRILRDRPIQVKRLRCI